MELKDAILSHGHVQNNNNNLQNRALMKYQSRHVMFSDKFLIIKRKIDELFRIGSLMVSQSGNMQYVSYSIFKYFSFWNIDVKKRYTLLSIQYVY